MRQRKGAVILTSARGLFLAKGYGATTVDEIAETAHVSKATVYNNFPDKAAVLAELLVQVGRESDQILAGVVAMLHGPEPIADRLERTAAALARGVVQPEVLQLRRLALTEAARHPVEITSYYEQGPGRMLRLLERAFTSLHVEQLLIIDDPSEAAARFAYSVVGPAQDRCLLTNSPPDPVEIERDARAAARAFFAAHRPKLDLNGPEQRSELR